MWVWETFMTLKVNLHDVEKYLFKWLRVFRLCERTWVRVLSMPIVCYLIQYYFYNIIFLILLSDNIIIKLY